MTAITAISRKLLVLMYGVWKTKTVYQDDFNLHLSQMASGNARDQIFLQVKKAARHIPLHKIDFGTMYRLSLPSSETKLQKKCQEIRISTQNLFALSPFALRVFYIQLNLQKKRITHNKYVNYRIKGIYEYYFNAINRRSQRIMFNGYFERLRVFFMSANFLLKETMEKIRRGSEEVNVKILATS